MDWYPWGEEAFQRARVEDKPVLLSIGYSSCHWCHVMERESFENEQTARLMNGNFVSIKVDREERPDLDHIYMEAVQAITGQGGWPLTVFLTPKGEPFFGGTYFPPQDAHGLLGFPKILKAAADAYSQRRGEVARSVEAIRAHLQQVSHEKPPAGVLSEDLLKHGYSRLADGFDRRNGGFGGAPKFPQPMALEFLLRFCHRTGDPRALEIVEHTLKKMAAGGIYDQLGGGFHRYATDAVWLVPHFEKMLYDNALLSRIYLHAYQVTGKAEYGDMASGTLDYVLREMTSPDGGFYSAQDADSEGEEGKYYLWTPEEFGAALTAQTVENPPVSPFTKGGGYGSPPYAEWALNSFPPFPKGDQGGLVAIAASYFGVTAAGNYEGKNILHVASDIASLAKETNLDPTEVESCLRAARKSLLAARDKRVPPGRDEKVLAGWNGLMISAMAEAGRVLDEPRYLEAAKKAASFHLSNLWDGHRLLRTYTGGEAKVTAFLEDYASVAGGLLDLYEATLDHRWLEPVVEMAAVMTDEFWDEGEGTFFDSGKSAEKLVARPRNIFDNAIPCGGSLAAGLLLRLGLLTGKDEFARIAAMAMGPMAPYMAEHPLGFANWLATLDFYLSSPLELVIAGPPDDARTVALLSAACKPYLPNKVLAGRHAWTPPGIAGLPLLEGRAMTNGLPTAYPCQSHRCLEPATSPEALAARIASLQQRS